MGFRDYSPGLNRFLTRDSYNGALADMNLGLNPFTGNRYAFGAGNPISLIELDGHDVIIAPGPMQYEPLCGDGWLHVALCFGSMIPLVGDAAVAYDSHLYREEGNVEKAEALENALGASISVSLGLLPVGLFEMGARVMARNAGRAAEREAAEAARIRKLGIDPAIGGKFRQSEADTAVRIEQERGVRLQRAGEGDSWDWVDESGATYDAVGNFSSKYFDRQWTQLQKQIIKHLEKAYYVPVDVSQFTPEQVAKVEEFIAPLGLRVFTVGGPNKTWQV